jgi:hypothetical protein
VSVRESIQSLIDERAQALAELPWASERDRWDELLFSTLVEVSPSVAAASTALAIFRALDLTTPARLAVLNDDIEARSLASAILLRLAFVSGQTEKALAQLVAVGRTVQSQMGGKVQRFLRSYGERMRDDFVGQLVDEGGDAEVLNAAVTRWLQNVLAMPVSLRQRSLLEFAGETGAGIDEATNVADDLDLSVAALDHLVDLRRRARDGSA